MSDIIDLAEIRRRRAEGDKPADRDLSLHYNQQDQSVEFKSPDGQVWEIKDVAEVRDTAWLLLDWASRMEKAARPPPPPPVPCPFCEYPFRHDDMTQTGKFPKHKRYTFSGGHWGSSYFEPVCPASLRSPVSAKKLKLARGLTT